MKYNDWLLKWVKVIEDDLSAEVANLQEMVKPLFIVPCKKFCAVVQIFYLWKEINLIFLTNSNDEIGKERKEYLEI